MYGGYVVRLCTSFILSMNLLISGIFLIKTLKASQQTLHKALMFLHIFFIEDFCIGCIELSLYPVLIYQESLHFLVSSCLPDFDVRCIN